MSNRALDYAQNGSLHWVNARGAARAGRRDAHLAKLSWRLTNELSDIFRWRRCDTTTKLVSRLPNSATETADTEMRHYPPSGGKWNSILVVSSFHRRARFLIPRRIKRTAPINCGVSPVFLHCPER